MAVADDSLPIQRSTFRSSNAEDTTEFIREMYIGNRTSFPDVSSENEFKTDLAGVGYMRADRVSGDLTLHLTGEPLDYALFGQLRRGTWNLGSRSSQVIFGPGDSLLYPIEEPFTLQAQHFDLAVASVPLDRLATMAANHTGIDARALRFHAMTPISPALARTFNATVAMVHREFHDPHATAAQPLIAEHLTQMMMAAVLATFPNTTMTSAPTSSAAHLSPAVVRRAVDFIDAHADQPLTLADIAAAAGASGRSLQDAFRRHYDTTPMAYLRRIRLECAHRDLQNADPTRNDTVAEIAARWGYRTPARFAAAYKTEYGVSPSHTLRT